MRGPVQLDGDLEDREPLDALDVGDHEAEGGVHGQGDVVGGLVRDGLGLGGGVDKEQSWSERIDEKFGRNRPNRKEMWWTDVLLTTVSMELLRMGKCRRAMEAAWGPDMLDC